MNRKHLGALCVIAGLTCSAPAAAQSTCTRESLQDIADSWIHAVEAGRMTEMKLGEWVDYTQNGARSSLGAALDKPHKVDWHMALLDTTTCKVYVEQVVLDPEHPEVVATQMGVGFFGTGPFNSIVTDKGDWLFDAKYTYEYARREDWSDLPADQQPTREALIAAADAYLDRFSNPKVAVPFGTPCARLEGSAYTGKNKDEGSCEVGIPEGVAMADRQYIVDSVKGAINVFLKMGKNERPDSHTFRMVNGKLRYIHTVTYCKEDNCGFDPFEKMLADRPETHPDPKLFGAG